MSRIISVHAYLKEKHKYQITSNKKNIQSKYKKAKEKKIEIKNKLPQLIQGEL